MILEQKEYVLKKYSGGYIIFSRSYISPLSQYKRIEQELRDKNYTGPVIFDLLMTNGDEFNRFIEIYFNGTSLDMISTKIVFASDAVIMLSNKHYIVNMHDCDWTVLPKRVRNAYGALRGEEKPIVVSLDLRDHEYYVNKCEHDLMYQWLGTEDAPCIGFLIEFRNDHKSFAIECVFDVNADDVSEYTIYDRTLIKTFFVQTKSLQGLLNFLAKQEYSELERISSYESRW